VKKEALGNKFFDFLGASLPIVTGAVSDGEMAQDINDNQCGIVVEPEDDEALYQSIRKLVSAP